MGNANKIKQKEAETIDRKLLKNIGKLGLVLATATGIAGGVSELSKAANKGVMATELANNAEKIEVESVSIIGGPNLRSDAKIPDGAVDVTENNVILDFGESDQNIELPYEGVMYIYGERGDANGEWCGFPAEEFADALQKSDLISADKKDEIIEEEKEDDNTVWINRRYVEYTESEASGKNINQQN